MSLKLKRYPTKSPNWYVRGTVAGIRVFESTETADKTLADAYRIKRERQVYEETALGHRQPATFAEAVTAYVSHGGSERFLLPLLDHFKERPISEIGQSEVDRAAHLLYPGKKPATLIRHVYTPMSAVLNHAHRAELPGATPCRLKKPKVTRTVVQWAQDDYLAALLPHCGKRLAALMLLMTFSGLRVSEAIRLRRADFDARAGWAHVGRTKSGKPRMIPLPRQVVEAVAEVMPAKDKPFDPVFGYSSRWSVNTALKRAAARAKLPYLSPHKVGRHAFAARMLAKGYPLKVVKEAGGWASIAVLDQNYGHLEMSDAHDAMQHTAASVEDLWTAAGSGIIRKRSQGDS